MKIIKKFKVKGLTVYKITAEHCMLILGGLGICDFCNNFSMEGYYIPVLNSYYCIECYNTWVARARHYVEDDKFERNCINSFENLCEKKGFIIYEENT